MIKSEQINLVAAALVKAQSEMGNASKGSANPFFKSKYADLNSIREACLPALAANGLSVLQPTVIIDGKNYIETMILHESGQYLGGHTEILFSKPNDAQNFGAGTTYARRFGLQAFLCIGAEDDDGEKAVGRSSSNKNTIGSQTNYTVANSPKQDNVTTIETVPTPAKRGFGIAKAVVVESTVPSNTVTNTSKTDDWS